MIKQCEICKKEFETKKHGSKKNIILNVVQNILKMAQQFLLSEKQVKKN